MHNTKPSFFEKNSFKIHACKTGLLVVVAGGASWQLAIQDFHYVAIALSPCSLEWEIGGWDSIDLVILPPTPSSLEGELGCSVILPSARSSLEWELGDSDSLDLVILPPARSFSGNGLHLTNAKTGFVAGFGLHHWSSLEGELGCSVILPSGRSCLEGEIDGWDTF